MTLILSALPLDHPVVLGDILITSPHDETSNLRIPTVGDTSLIKNAQIVHLAQKISVINDSLIAAWGGNYECAKRILTAMAQHFIDIDGIKIEDVGNFLATTQYEDQRNICLAGATLDGPTIGMFGLNIPEIDLPFFGKSRVGGSGATSLISYCSQLPANITCSDADSAMTAVAGSLGLLCGMIGSEITFGENLEKRFGGFFEVATLMDHKFQKVNNIGYAIWHIPQHSKTNMELALLFVIKLEYQNGLLIIRRAKFNGLAANEDETFIIGSIHRTWSNDELRAVKAPDPNSQHWCHCVVVDMGSDRQFLCQTHWNDNDSKLRFTPQGKQTMVSFHNDLFTSFFNEIQNKFHS